jgi:hypothetical protein
MIERAWIAAGDMHHALVLEDHTPVVIAGTRPTKDGIEEGGLHPLDGSPLATFGAEQVEQLRDWCDDWLGENA